MNRILLTLAAALPLALLSLTASAQSVFVKVGGGYASQYGAPGYSAAAKVALGYEYEFSQSFAFAPSIGFSGRGWQLQDVSTPDMLFDAAGNMLTANGQITTDPSQQGQRYTELLDANGQPILGLDGKPMKGDPMFSMMHRTFSANYVQLDLPFNYYYRLGESRYVTFTAGPWLACGFAGKRKTEGDGRATNDRKIRYTDSTFSLDGAQRFDCGLKAGIGYQFPSSLTINVEGEFGLLKTNKATAPFGDRAGRNLDVMLTLSYKLNKHLWKGDD